MGEPIDTSLKYRLTNSYSGSGKALAAKGDSIAMEDAGTSTSQYWYFVETKTAKKYRLHTVAGGDGKSLDVLNDQGVNSTALRMFDTGESAGQYWILSKWSNGGYALTNDFTGQTKRLDVYADTLRPHLEKAPSTGQRWTIENVDGGSSRSSAPASTSSKTGTDTATSSVAPTATNVGGLTTMLAVISRTTTGPGGTPTVVVETETRVLTLGAGLSDPGLGQSTSALPSTTAAAAGAAASGSSLSTGGIVGVAFGAFFSIALIAMAILFIMRRHPKTPPSPAESSREMIGARSYTGDDASFAVGPGRSTSRATLDPRHADTLSLIIKDETHLSVSEIDGRMSMRHDTSTPAGQYAMYPINSNRNTYQPFRPEDVMSYRESMFSVGPEPPASPGPPGSPALVPVLGPAPVHPIPVSPMQRAQIVQIVRPTRSQRPLQQMPSMRQEYQNQPMEPVELPTMRG